MTRKIEALVVDAQGDKISDRDNSLLVGAFS